MSRLEGNIVTPVPSEKEYFEGRLSPGSLWLCLRVRIRECGARASSAIRTTRFPTRGRAAFAGGDQEAPVADAEIAEVSVVGLLRPYRRASTTSAACRQRHIGMRQENRAGIERGIQAPPAASRKKQKHSAAKERFQLLRRRRRGGGTGSRAFWGIGTPPRPNENAKQVGRCSNRAVGVGPELVGPGVVG